MKSTLPVVNRYGLILGWAFVIAVMLLHAPPGQAEEVIGEVTRSQNMPDFPRGKKIYRETRIETGSDQKIAIKTTDGDVLVASENAQIKLQKPGFFSHLFGKIYYLITPKKKRDVTVQTRAATIGIRGTRFLIDSDSENSEKENVSLVEGKLNFKSNDDELFELYERREMNEFEKFKRQYMSEYEAYKKQMIEEFVAYKASINLDAGYALSFDGKKVTRTPIEQELDAEIAEFEKFLLENSLN